MPKKPHPGRAGHKLTMAPLTMNEAVDAVFAIKPKDVKKVLASKPGKKAKKK